MAEHVTVHTLAQARRALEQARRRSESVILESPPGAAGWQGIGWWRAMLDRLAGEFPDLAFGSVLDCADCPGLALAALRAGIPAVRLAAGEEILAALADIAGQLGAKVEHGRLCVNFI
jgi:hypothetical protein